MAKTQDNFDEWLEGDAAEPPSEPRTYHGMTDAELSAAICRAAIKEGHDPAAEGVIPSALVMSEEDAEELAYNNQLKANLALAISSHFGVDPQVARANLVATGTIPLAPDACPVEQATLNLMVDKEEVQDLVFEGLTVEGKVDLSALKPPTDLEVFAAFVRKVEHYDTWLRPFAVFMGSLLFAGAAGLSGGSTIFLMVMAYGLICHGFKPKQKAIGSGDPVLCVDCNKPVNNDDTRSDSPTCDACWDKLRPDTSASPKTKYCDRCELEKPSRGFRRLPYGPGHPMSDICKYCVPYVKDSPLVY